MQRPSKPKPKKPLGHVISWTDSDLAEMSQVSATDKKAAEALWKNEAPVQFKALLQAEVIDGTK